MHANIMMTTNPPPIQPVIDLVSFRDLLRGTDL